MSSKKAKAARKASLQSVVVSEFDNFGVPVGFKIQGKPVFLAFGFFSEDRIAEVFRLNSEEHVFTVLDQKPPLLGSVDEVVAAGVTGTEYNFDGLALGVFIIRDKSRLVEVDHHVFLDDEELLPFKVGGPRFWRSPKLGSLISEDDDVLVAREAEASFYYDLFPGFKSVYKIEQVVTVEPISDSQDLLIDKFVRNLFS